MAFSLPSLGTTSFAIAVYWDTRFGTTCHAATPRLAAYEIELGTTGNRPFRTYWVLVEPDIDYFRSMAAHALLEVLPGFFGLTDPTTVYVLRWIAGRQANVPEFNPPYTIRAARAS